MAFTRSGGFIRCFSIRSDLYEYLEKNKKDFLKLSKVYVRNSEFMWVSDFALLNLMLEIACFGLFQMYSCICHFLCLLHSEKREMTGS